MQVAPFPPDEELRIENLLSYGILDTEEENDFNELAELVAQICNCPYALISFIDQERQWFKARRNVNMKVCPRNLSICSHTILQEDVMVIKDTKKDQRFFDNPLATGVYKISFYAGVPIISAEGFKIGTVCAMDKRPKLAFTNDQKNNLRIISHQVATLLELNKKNKQAEVSSDALVAGEKKIVQLSITEHDEERSFIANELHENFAQTLAATKLYLDFAEKSKELSSYYIKKSKSNILQIIKEIIALSKSMLPSTFEGADYLEFIKELLHEYGLQNNLEIRFRHDGNLNCYISNTGLTIFRIIQYQLKNANVCGAKNLSINIKTGKSIRLEFVDDGKNSDEFESERGMLLQHIETRIGILNGTVNVSLDKQGHNLVRIEIPRQVGL